MYQKTVLIGRLGKDATVTKGKKQNGYATLNFNIATESPGSKSKGRPPTTYWHMVRKYGEEGGIVNLSSFLKKGTIVLCEGMFKYFEVDEEGSKWKKKVYYFYLNSLTFLQGQQKDNTPPPHQEGPPPQQEGPPPQQEEGLPF